MCLGEKRTIKNKASKQGNGTYGDIAASEKGLSGRALKYSVLMVHQFKGSNTEVYCKQGERWKPK